MPERAGDKNRPAIPPSLAADRVDASSYLRGYARNLKKSAVGSGTVVRIKALFGSQSIAQCQVRIGAAVK